MPSFSVDRGFWYSVPASFAPDLAVGRLVRVPLGGRRVRGYVVETGKRDVAKLKPIAGLSGDVPIFGPRLRDALSWAAHHYVAPVSVLLERAAPPNLPKRTPGTISTEAISTGTPVSPPDHPLRPLVEAAVAGRRRPVTALLTAWGDTTWIAALAPLLVAGRSVLVVVGTAAETALLARSARAELGPEAVIEAPGDLDDATTTSRWGEAVSRPGRLVIGTPRVAAWPVAALGLVVAVEEGRRSMKERQTPTVAVRRLLGVRGRIEGLGQVYVGPTPSLEVVASGANLVGRGGRAWPLVEVVDRGEEPPGSGLVLPRSRAAIGATLRAGGTVFVFTHRRGYAPAYRCASCREIRLCPGCGSRPEPGVACPRCGAPSQPCRNCGGSTFEPLGAGAERILHELSGVFRHDAGEAGSGAAVSVGTERDLAGLEGVDLAVAVDVDGLALGSHFRAAEEALRVLARLAGRVRRGRGRRLILQTALPDHPLVLAMRRGDPVEFLRAELARREEMGYPPATEMMIVEARGEGDGIDGDLRSVADESVELMGPAETHAGRRWLVQGQNLGGFKLALRPLVQRWRDTGATVRVDVDPLDL